MIRNYNKEFNEALQRLYSAFERAAKRAGNAPELI